MTDDGVNSGTMAAGIDTLSVPGNLPSGVIPGTNTLVTNDGATVVAEPATPATNVARRDPLTDESGQQLRFADNRGTYPRDPATDPNGAAEWAKTLGKLQEAKAALPGLCFTQINLTGYHDNVPSHWRTSEFTAVINQNSDTNEVRTADGQTFPL